MGMIACIDGGGAPGVSTTVAALATHWPRPVLVADADPHGGALLPRWLAPWWSCGHLRADRGAVSFALATRDLGSVPAEGLFGHVQTVPDAPHVRVLAGVGNRAEAAAVGMPGWTRLASALRDLTGETGPDVLVDAGRWDLRHTPWPLVDHADLVLIGLRPNASHLAAARRLRSAVTPERTGQRLGALVVTASPRQAARITRDLGGMSMTVSMPDDPSGARALGCGSGPPRRYRTPVSPLVLASRCVALRLSEALHPRGLAPSRASDSVAATGETR